MHSFESALEHGDRALEHLKTPRPVRVRFVAGDPGAETRGEHEPVMSKESLASLAGPAHLRGPDAPGMGPVLERARRIARKDRDAIGRDANTASEAVERIFTGARAPALGPQDIRTFAGDPGALLASLLRALEGDERRARLAEKLTARGILRGDAIDVEVHEEVGVPATASVTITAKSGDRVARFQVPAKAFS